MLFLVWNERNNNYYYEKSVGCRIRGKNINDKQEDKAGDLHSLPEVGNLRILNANCQEVKPQKCLKHGNLSNQRDFVGILDDKEVRFFYTP